MTVSSTSNRVVYQGNGTTTVFPFAFKIQQAADLVVVYTDTTGTEFTLSPSQYSASGFGLDAGGSVTYPASGGPIASGTTLTIYRDVAPTQPTSISNQGAMWPQVIEGALDRLTFIVQKIADIASRSLTISPTDSGSLNPLPNTTSRANSYLAFDGSGQPIAVQNLSLASVSAWLASNVLPTSSAAAALSALGGLAANLGLAKANNLSDVASVPSARANLKVDSRTAVADTAYTVLSSDYMIAYTTLTASRTVTLPAANTFNPGRRLVIIDESGAASQARQILLTPNGTDAIAGSNTTQVIINIPFGRIELGSNGTTGWFVVGPWSVVYASSLSSDVAVNNAGYSTGPSVAQGTVGTWRAYGKVTVDDTGSADHFFTKLWDGTIIGDSGWATTTNANWTLPAPLCAVFYAPSGNIRISATSSTASGGAMKANGTGNGKDCTLTVERIA